MRKEKSKDGKIKWERAKTLLLAFCVVFMCAGCSEDEEPAVITPSVESETAFAEGVSFASLGGEKTISFTTNKDWIIEMMPADGSTGTEWCTVTPSQGSAGDASVVIRIVENTGYDKRELSLTLRAGDLTYSINVSQNQKGGMLLPTTEYEVDSEGGTIQVEVQANVDYWVSITGNAVRWIHEAADNRALESEYRTYTIDAYSGYEPREGIITFHSFESTVDDISVRVLQNGSATLNIPQKEYVVSDEGGEITIEVQSNFECKVRMPQVDWIAEIPSTGTYDNAFHYEIAPNTTFESRQAELVFYDERETVQEVVVITQDALGLIINEQGIELMVEGQQQLTYQIAPDIDSANLAWSSSDESVVTVSPDGVVTAVSKGTAVVTLTAADGTAATSEITVYELTDKMVLSYKAELQSYNGGHVSGSVYSIITNNSNETIHLETLTVRDGMISSVIYGQKTDLNVTLEPGDSYNLGMNFNGAYRPVFIWTFTANGKEYRVSHQPL